MRFDRRPQAFAPTQKAIMALLDESPLPWTLGMLNSWFPLQITFSLQLAVNNRRVWRCAYGLYTSMRHYESRVVIVSDKMLEKYGFNL